MSRTAEAVAALVLLAAAFGLGIATMVNGYGVHIESWGWLIGGCVGQLVILALISALKE